MKTQNELIEEVLRLDDDGRTQAARLIRDLKAQRDMAVEALEDVLDCRSFGEHGEFNGWRISAGASHGGGLTQRAAKADETLAKIKSDEWVDGTSSCHPAP